MTLTDRLSLLSPLDAAAVAIAILAWIGIGWRIEHPGRQRLSVTVLMTSYRLAWMREFVTRQPRIYDAQIVAQFRQGTAFYASTCLFALGGLLALAGNPAPLVGLAEDLRSDALPVVIWQIKLGLVAVFLLDAFLKNVWSNRLFGYCMVMMSAVPNAPEDPCAYPRAAQAGQLNIRAAWNFNRGLRSVYFALASVAWLLGPWPLIVAVSLTVWLLWQREFASIPRDIILSQPPPDTP